MIQVTKTKGVRLATSVMSNLTTPRKKLPESFLKAAGIIRDAKQRRDLERHVKKMRAEWR